MFFYALIYQFLSQVVGNHVIWAFYNWWTVKWSPYAVGEYPPSPVRPTSTSAHEMNNKIKSK